MKKSKLYINGKKPFYTYDYREDRDHPGRFIFAIVYHFYNSVGAEVTRTWELASASEKNGLEDNQTKTMVNILNG